LWTVKFGLTKLETDKSLILYHVMHKIFQYTETGELFKYGFTRVTDRQTEGQKVRITVAIACIALRITLSVTIDN